MLRDRAKSFADTLAAESFGIGKKARRDPSYEIPDDEIPDSAVEEAVGLLVAGASLHEVRKAVTVVVPRSGGGGTRKLSLTRRQVQEILSAVAAKKSELQSVTADADTDIAPGRGRR